MVILIAPVLAAIVGALVYALSANPKASELGRIAFACGLLVSLFVAATQVVRL